MKAPPLPTNETERLERLRALEVLDTAPESSLDDLTQLAAAIFEVPISLVSLVDEHRQWFKSRYGLATTETPRSVSFCGHLVAEGKPLIVKDSLADQRFADNPLVTGEPWVRFYAGVPLQDRDGFVLGSLCAIDHVPRDPTPRQMEQLGRLAKMVVGTLEAGRDHARLETERAAAREDAQRYDLLLEAMAEGVLVQDASGAITSANLSAQRILGLSIDQMMGRTSMDPAWRAVHEDGTPFAGEAHPAMVALATGEGQTNVIMGLQRLGTRTWISINSLPLRDAGEERPHAVVTTFHDITALKAAQAAAERISRQEHLVTTGTLASGIGHEINNPLASILANIEYTAGELRQIAAGTSSQRVSDLVGVLGEVTEGVERIRDVVRGLRSLVRPESEPLPTDLANAVEISLNVAAHELRHKARVTAQLAPTPPVLADDARLSQVLVNLLVNAAQAFPNSDVERNQIHLTSALEPDGRISITVADNGPGIPAELQRRIFDPFFTTRPVGQGTGLGLCISQNIVLALGGEITVESTVGQGSRFRVCLPAAAVPVAAEGASPGSTAAARGRVLIVDDETAILNALRRVLGRDHDVVAVSDPREALHRLEAGERFDVVFCDLMMPHLGGDALYRRVHALDPGQAERFVFVSGCATEPRLRAFLAEVPNERVDKPFSTQNLRGITRRFVRARSSGG